MLARYSDHCSLRKSVKYYGRTLWLKMLGFLKLLKTSKVTPNKKNKNRFQVLTPAELKTKLN